MRLPLWNLILGWLLTVFIVVGNGLVIYLITTRRKLWTTANWFVLSLAVSDFGVGALYYPRFCVCTMYPKMCPKDVANVSFCLIIIFLFASVTNLCALTLDRYLAVVKPLRYVTLMTKKRVAILVFAAWSAPSPVMLFCLASKFSKEEKTHDLITKTFWMSLGFLNVSACVFLLLVTAKVLGVVRRIARQNATLDAQLNFNYRRQRKRAFKTREAASAKLVSIMVAFFVVCYLTDTFITVTLRTPLSFPNVKAVLGVFFHLTRFLKLANSAVNPVVYALYKREIRRELK